MHPRRALPAHATSLLVVPWDDPVIDQVGYDPRAAYVERFWLGILGPSATWLLRLLVDRLDRSPDGYRLDLGECASTLGLGHRGASGAFPRTVNRCCQFGAARFLGGVTFEVRRKLPPLSARQIARLSPVLQADHARWVHDPPRLAHDDLLERARQLAVSLLQLGEGPAGTERQLQRWRFRPALAAEATAWALHHEARAHTAPDPPAAAGTTTPDPPAAAGTTTPDPPAAAGTATPDPPAAGGTTTPDPPAAAGTTTPDPPAAAGTTTPDPPAAAGTATPRHRPDYPAPAAPSHHTGRQATAAHHTGRQATTARNTTGTDRAPPPGTPPSPADADPRQRERPP